MDLVYYAAWAFVIAGTVFVHESGHVAAFRFFGRKVGIRVTWWGAEAGTGKDTFALAPWKMFFVYAAGPIVGYSAAWLSGNATWMLYYWVICIGDFWGMFSMMNIPRSYMKRPYRDFVAYLLKESEEAQ